MNKLLEKAMKNGHRNRLKKAAEPIKLDIACGQNKQQGYVGVDIAAAPGVDVVHDLTVFPWPFADASASEAWCSHYFEHVPGRLRMRWMDEVHRILVPGGKLTVICPYYTSMRAVQDPTHEWPPVCEASFLYFNAAWRQQNKLDHYPVACDFDFTFGYAPAPEWANRNEEARSFAIKHYANAVMDLHVVLTKRPGPQTE